MANDIAALVIKLSTEGAEKVASALGMVRTEGLKAAQAIERSGATMTATMQGVAQSTKVAHTASEEFTNSLLKFGRTLASIAAVYYTFKNVMGIAQHGIEFNKVVEESQLSLAALISSMYDYKDSTGAVVQGSNAFEAAIKDAIKLQKELRVAGLTTAATYQELVRGLQIAFAPAQQAGIGMDKIVSFVQRFTQVMQVMDVPMNQMSEEIRSFLTGAMVQRQTRLESFWVGLGLTNEKIKELISTNQLYTETMKRTAMIEMMAARSTQTWTVALSNLIDAFQNIMGQGLQGTFSSLKRVFIDLFDWIVKINTETKEITFNPNLLSWITAFSEKVEFVIEKLRALKQASDAFEESHPQLVQIGSDFGWIGVKLLALYGAGSLIGRLFKAVFGGLGRFIQSAVGWFLRLGPAIAGVGAAFVALEPTTKIVLAVLTVLLILLSYFIPSMRQFTQEVGGGLTEMGESLLDWVGSWKIGQFTIRTHMAMIGSDLKRLGLALGLITEDKEQAPTTWLQGWLQTLTDWSDAFDKYVGEKYDQLMHYIGVTPAEPRIDKSWWEKDLEYLKGLYDKFVTYITPSKESDEKWLMYQKQHAAAQQYKAYTKYGQRSVYPTENDEYIPGEALEAVRKSGPQEITGKALTLWREFEAAIARINEEASRLTDDMMVRLLSHLEKQNIMMDNLLDKMRKEGQLKEFIVFLEEQHIRARERLIRLTLERNEQDFRMFMAQNVLPDVVGKFEEIDIRIQKLREQFSADLPAAMKKFVDGQFDVYGVTQKVVDSASKAAQATGTAVNQMTTNLTTGMQEVIARVETNVGGMTDIPQRLQKIYRAIPPEIDAIIVKQAEANNISTELLRNIMRLEAPRGFNPAGYGPVIPDKTERAVGLMQMLPSTGADFGVTEEGLKVPEKAVEAAAKYLKGLLRRYGDSLMLAAGAYFAGQGNMDNIVAQGGMNLGENPNTMKYMSEFLLLQGSAGQVAKIEGEVNQRLKERLGYTKAEGLDRAKLIMYAQAELQIQETALSFEKSLIDMYAQGTTDVGKEVELRKISIGMENELTRIKTEQYIWARKLGDVEAKRVRSATEEAIAARDARQQLENQYKPIQLQNEAWQKILSAKQAVANVTPYQEEELALSQQILEAQQKIRDAELKQWLNLNTGLNPELKKSVLLWNEQQKAAEKLLLVIKALKEGQRGMAGLMAAWSYDRLKESFTRAYDTFKGIMQDVERSLGDAIYNAVTRKQSWSEIATALHEAITKRFSDYFAQMAFDKLGKWGMETFGSKFGLDKFIKRDGSSPERALYVTTGGELGGFSDNKYWDDTIQDWVTPAEKMGEANQQATGFFGMMSSLFGSFLKALGPIGNIIWQFLNGIANLFSSIGGAGGGGGGGIGSLLGSAVGFIGSLFGLGGGGGGGGWMGGGLTVASAGITPLSVGGFQHGGIVTNPTLAMIGEAGPEAVIPLRGGRIPIEGSSTREQRPVIINFHVHGVADSRSYKKSEEQIKHGLGLAVSRSMKRTTG